MSSNLYPSTPTPSPPKYFLLWYSRKANRFHPGVVWAVIFLASVPSSYQESGTFSITTESQEVAQLAKNMFCHLLILRQGKGRGGEIPDSEMEEYEWDCKILKQHCNTQTKGSVIAYRNIECDGERHQLPSLSL